MSGTASARGGLGWAILAIALAVPGVLFYNWWSHLKAERAKTVMMARGRVPDGRMFKSSPNVKLLNPMTPVASTTTVADAAPVPIDAVRPPAFSSSTATVPPFKRDPTLSPFDQVRIIEQEEAKRKAAEDMENMKRRRTERRRQKVREADPTALVALQGIVSNLESGYRAIVNNEVVGIGEYIKNTRIKIIKITDLDVTFMYQGKKFSKGVSRD